MKPFKKIQRKLAFFRANRLGTYSTTSKTNLNVLVVDNEKINQLFLAEQLKKFGITADIANHGAEALSMMSEVKYDIIFMDLEMPVMDGIEATRKIKALYSDSPAIIGYSSLQSEYYQRLCIQEGMVYLLPKKATQAQIGVVLDKIYRMLSNSLF